MKKIIVLAFIVFGITTLRAQEKTNNKVSGDGFTYADIFVSGAISFGSVTNGFTNTNTFTFSPKAGYFVNDNIAVGLDFSYESEKTEQDILFTNAINKIKERGITAGLFGRYYINPESKFSIFGELGLGFNNTKRVGSNQDFDRNGLRFVFTTGINYFVSNHFALEASVGLIQYDTFKFDDGNSESIDAFFIGLDLTNINLGVVYRF